MPQILLTLFLTTTLVYLHAQDWHYKIKRVYLNGDLGITFEYDQEQLSRIIWH